MEMREMEVPGETPLAQVQEMGELKRRYAFYDSGTLMRWREAVKGCHRGAMEEILRERGVL